MPTRRQHKINELILEELSMLVPGRFDDPRIAGVSVTRVEATQDLSTAKVYYICLEGDDEEEVARALQQTEGVLRAELARLGLRRLPHLAFTRDKGFESGQRVLDILGRLKPAPDDDEDDSGADAPRRGDEPLDTPVDDGA